MICDLVWMSQNYGLVKCELRQGHRGNHYWSKGPRWSWISPEEVTRKLNEGLGPALQYKKAYDHLATQLANPPAGWFTFGTHIDKPNVELRFWGVDDGGMPIWEQPI